MTLYGPPFADPLRPWETDADQWMPADPGQQHGLDLTDGATVLTGRWIYVIAAVVGLLGGTVLAAALWRWLNR